MWQPPPCSGLSKEYFLTLTLTPLPGGVDLCHEWGGAAHEEQRGTEDHGDDDDGGSHTGNGLQRENTALHEDPSKQHPQSRSREVHSTYRQREAGLGTQALECYVDHREGGMASEGTFDIFNCNGNR